MIKRIWHGFTTVDKAEEYESLLKNKIIPGIAERSIPGYRGISVLRRENGDEIEFITIMQFDSLESVRGFVGDDYEVAHVPAEARAVLKRFDERSQHYELRDHQEYQGV
jgi:antibiotic biosynthesis monooxygenase (ABM) superfamily enzyme